MKTYGRNTIYVKYTEEDVLKASPEKQKEIVVDIIKSSEEIHNQNRIETLYLKDYAKGLQDIYVDKIKHTRTEIDNKTVENWAYAFIDFKKSKRFLFIRIK